jgi:hypothetical protein
MKKIKFIIIIIMTGLFSSCTDYLNRENLDTFTSDNFWKSEINLRLYAQQFYPTYFSGYGQLFTYGPVFSWAEWADDQVSSSQWESNVATSGNGWSFTNVRSHNILIARTDIAPIGEEAKNHWKGIGRFFRALEYSNLCSRFGDVPWYDKELLTTDLEDLYKPRDPLESVLKNILSDFEFAAENVRLKDEAGQINRYVVLGFMSRKLLYFGTYLKYHNGDHELSKTLLQKAAWAANQIISSGNYSISDNYRGLFTSEDLSTNKEVIFYREYEAAKVTHAILSYNNTEGQTGLTKNAFDTYLASDGFPIKQSPLYNYAIDNGRRNFRDAYKNRDPRLYGTIVDSLRLNKVDAAPSTTGISSWKFLPEVITTETKFTSSFNVTDCPILRYGEVLLNYIEAVGELGTITQADLDKTINVLHNRSIRYNGKGTGAVAPKLPSMQLNGSNLSVNGVVLNDPDHDASVSSLIWEIRRERRVELMFEGFRKDDLWRWGKFEYLLTNQVKNGGVPTDLAIGAYIDTLDYPRVTKLVKWKTLLKNKDIRLYYPNPSDQGKGYILVLYDVTQQRDWVKGQSFFERQYLRSVPIDQITMYKDMGVTLTQNPGWE